MLEVFVGSYKRASVLGDSSRDGQQEFALGDIDFRASWLWLMSRADMCISTPEVPASLKKGVLILGNSSRDDQQECVFEMIISGLHGLSLALSHHFRRDAYAILQTKQGSSNATTLDQDPRTRSLTFNPENLFASSALVLSTHKQIDAVFRRSEAI